MSDLRINTAGDLDLTVHTVPLATGSDAVGQHLAMRLRTVRGEWIFDQRVGTPYVERVFGRRRMEDVEGVFRRVILDTPGVDSIQAFTMTLDTETRALSIETSVRLLDLTTIVLTFTDLLMEVTE